MSSGSGSNSQNSSQPPLDKSLQEAFERAKQLAVAASGQKRSNSEELNYNDSKRPNLNGSTMAGLGMGGPIGGVGGGGPEPFVENIDVPDNVVGLVIGRGGENISMIQQTSGARVQLANESNATGFRQCTIQGTRPAIDKAKQLVTEVIERSNNRSSMGRDGQNGSGGAGSVTAEILIPGNKCGLIIGKGGDTIKSLQETLGVKMLLIQDSHAVTVGPKPLRIMGYPDKVENAKRVVEQMMNSDDGNVGFRLPAPQRSIGEVIVPRSSVGIIIGKGGETIKRLGAETGAKIQFKQDEDPNAQDRTAVIQGTPEQINRATHMISDLVTRGARSGGQEMFFMHVPANKTGLVIGKGGDTIKQICAESGAHVELSRDPMPNPNEKVFIIKGSPYQIHHAQHIIRIKVGDIQPGTPMPPFQGGMGGMQGGMTAANPYGPTAQYGAGGDHYGAGNQWGQTVGQDASAWAQYYSQQQAGYGATTQPGYAAQTQPYQMPGQQMQPQQQQIHASGQQQQMVGGAAPTAAAPAINPQTGQADYSAQWCEYYRSMGMHEQANMIEQQMKQQQQQPQQQTIPQAARPQQQAYYSS